MSWNSGGLETGRNSTRVDGEQLDIGQASPSLQLQVHTPEHSGHHLSVYRSTKPRLSFRLELSWNMSLSWECSSSGRRTGGWNVTSYRTSAIKPLKV